jgi:hypothetical protein
MQQATAKKLALVQGGCMLLFGIIWTLIALLIFFASWSLRAPWIFQLGTGVFVLFGLGMVAKGAWGVLLKPAIQARYVGPATAQLSRERLRPGDALTVRYEQPVRTEVEIGTLAMQMILREWAQYRRGTNTYTVFHDNIVDAYEEPGRRMQRGETILAEHTFRLPVDAMHSVTATHNRLLWLVRITLALPGAPDVAEHVGFEVAPEIDGEAGNAPTV